MTSEFDKLVGVFKELQIPFSCHFDGEESSVDTPFASYRFLRGEFVEVLKRDVTVMGRGGATLGWAESQALGVVAGEGME